MGITTTRGENEIIQPSTSLSDPSEIASEELNKRVLCLKQHFIQISQKLNKPAYRYDDLGNSEIYNLHSNLLLQCANSVLVSQGRKFQVDDANKKVLRFLIYYFNNCPLALKVFENTNYSLDKNILLVGNVGTGKTLIMDAFALYLKETKNPNAFYNISQTQILNSYKLNNNLDKFIYNERDTRDFEGKPTNLCINDIGLPTSKFYGQDTKSILDELLYARYEIWTTNAKKTHLTTNLDKKDIQQLFQDDYGRLQDRFKMYNVIPMVGDSRR